MPPSGLVIVCHHDIVANHHLGFYKIQSQEEKLLQNTAKQTDRRPPERAEKAFDRVRGEHLHGFVLDDGGIAGIFPQLVKTNQVGTGAAHKET